MLQAGLAQIVFLADRCAYLHPASSAFFLCYSCIALPCNIQTTVMQACSQSATSHKHTCCCTARPGCWGLQGTLQSLTILTRQLCSKQAVCSILCLQAWHGDGDALARRHRCPSPCAPAAKQLKSAKRHAGERELLRFRLDAVNSIKQAALQLPCAAIALCVQSKR